MAYVQARHIITLSDVNRIKQIADGAPPEKIEIVPNGVALKSAEQPRRPRRSADAGRRRVALPPPRLRVGFVGRVVPIKDVDHLHPRLRHRAQRRRAGRARDRTGRGDPGYAARCRQLVSRLGRTDQIRFVGPMPPDQIYGDLDVVVLTSFSEGQPLVILEAYAWGVPVVATDVGACREMIEGRTDGGSARSGRAASSPASPRRKETAAALVRLARDVRLRWRMGAAGHRRVTAFYQRRDMLARYRALYGR